MKLNLKICCSMLGAACTLEAATPPLRIMPLGDSITYGIGSADTAGYRGPLWTLLGDAGYAVDYVGVFADNPGTVAGMDADHCGREGWGVGGMAEGGNGLYEYVPGWLASIRDPHVILLHIGTNDTGDEQRFSQILGRYGRLLDRLSAAEPDARIVATTLLGRGDSVAKNGYIDTYFNAGIANLVAEHVAKGQHVTLVDMNKLVPNVPENFEDDLVHPNATGYALMAQAWYEEIVRLFPDPLQIPAENAPAVVQVQADTDCNATRSVLFFNQPVDEESLTDPANYVLADASFGMPAVSGVSDRAVKLTWAKSGFASEMKLTVSGVRNLGGVKTVPDQVLVWTNRSANTIAWEPAQNITGDADVATEGTLAYAYVQAKTATSVNGVAFAVGNGNGNLPPGVKQLPDLNVSGLSSYYSEFVPDTLVRPAGMSASYLPLISCGAFRVTSTETATITLNNLVPGHRYLVQLWANDSRTGSKASDEAGILIDNAVELRYRMDGTTFGQHAVGRFLADKSSMEIVLKPVGKAGLSLCYTAIQVRDVTPSAIRWEEGMTIYDDRDVHTEGSTVCAYNGTADTSFTVNGVTFSGIGTAGGSMTGGLKLVPADDDAIHNYYSPSAPLDANATYPETASATYRTMLGVLCYVSGATWNVQMDNLEVGAHYLVQFWYNDSRSSSALYYQRADGCARAYCQDHDNGRRGQHVTGRFVATASAMSFPICGLRVQGDGNASLVAIQLRRLDAAFSNGWQKYKFAVNANDVVTEGSTLYACVPGASDVTVNGVTFKGQNGNRTSWADGNVQIAGLTSYAATAFMSGYSGADLGTYKNLLEGGLWASYDASRPLSVVVTLSGLKPYTRYLLQMWVNDNRTSGNQRTVEFGTGSGIPYRSTTEPYLGPIGYARIVTDTNTTYAIETKYGVVSGYSLTQSSPQLNALQVREMPSLIDTDAETADAYKFREWTGYEAPWNDPTGSVTTAVLSHGGTMALAGKAYASGVLSGGNLVVNGTGGLWLAGELNAPTAQVDVAWLASDVSRMRPGLTVLNGAADAVRQFVVGTGEIRYAATASPARDVALRVSKGAVFTVASDLVVADCACAPDSTLAFVGTPKLRFSGSVDLSNVTCDLRACKGSEEVPFLTARKDALVGEPTCVTKSSNYRVEKRMTDTEESWYLIYNPGMMIIFR